MHWRKESSSAAFFRQILMAWAICYSAVENILVLFFFPKASRWVGNLNPRIWLVNYTLMTGPQIFPIRTTVWNLLRAICSKKNYLLILVSAYGKKTVYLVLSGAVGLQPWFVPKNWGTVFPHTNFPPGKWYLFIFMTGFVLVSLASCSLP